jgi:hypothetical protein
MPKHRRREHRKIRHYRHRIHKYTNLLLVVISIIIAFALSRAEVFHTFLLQMGNYGYAGAFIAGILFVSTFTVATGGLILLVLAEKLSPVEIALIAGAGAVVGDLLIFHVVKDNLTSELVDLYHRFGGKHFTHLLYTQYFRWSLPVIGALIIASPLPDELGVSLMGISQMNTLKFIPISFFLNSLGIFLILSASVFIKP